MPVALWAEPFALVASIGMLTVGSIWLVNSFLPAASFAHSLHIWLNLSSCFWIDMGTVKFMCFFAFFSLLYIFWMFKFCFVALLTITFNIMRSLFMLAFWSVRFENTFWFTALVTHVFQIGLDFSSWWSHFMWAI